MIRRPPRSTLSSSSAASDVYKRQINKAKEIQASLPDAWIPQQFENPANIQVHIETTAKEIIDDFPEGFDYLITGVGTGGHITGVARVMKKKFPNLKVFAVEPVYYTHLRAHETDSYLVCR